MIVVFFLFLVCGWLIDIVFYYCSPVEPEAQNAVPSKEEPVASEPMEVTEPEPIKEPTT